MGDQLEEIKKKIDIVQLVSEYIPLQKSGQNFKALCPFHSEKTPSFMVSPERQIWHCFGACNTGGDVFAFLMRKEGMEFGEALRVLAKRAGIKLVSYQPTEGERQKQVLYEINHLAAEYFHYLLLNHQVGKRALDYILGRGISKESLELFKLGYAPDMWEGLKQFLVGKKGYRVEDLEGAGLVIKSGVSRYYDRFRNRLMFPLTDHRGNICGFAGRILEKDAQEAKYINSPETVVYHKSDLLYGLSEVKEEIKKLDQVILVEGELDAISSYQVGVKNAVAIKGSALTASQVQLLGKFTKNLIFALDSDLAGDQAARRGIEIADAGGMAIKVVEVKGGKDPDEVAQKNPSLWRELVTKAVPIYDYFLDSAFSRFDGKTIEGKRKIAEELVPILNKITSEIIQSHYIQALAEKLAVEEEAVKAEIMKYEGEDKKLGAKRVSPAMGTSAKKERREILEEHLLGLCFQSGNWAYLRKRKVSLLIKTPRFARILETLGEYLRRYKKNESERLAKMLAAELQESFNQLYLLDLTELTQDEDKFQGEFEKTVYQLRRLDLKEQLKQLSTEVKNLEKQSGFSEKDQGKMDKLNEQFRDLLLRLTEIELNKE